MIAVVAEASVKVPATSWLYRRFGRAWKLVAPPPPVPLPPPAAPANALSTVAKFCSGRLATFTLSTNTSDAAVSSKGRTTGLFCSGVAAAAAGTGVTDVDAATHSVQIPATNDADWRTITATPDSEDRQWF